LDRLPLAISQAAAYIRRASISVAEYVRKLENEEVRWKLLGQSSPDPHRPPTVSNSVLQTLRISVDRIRQENLIAYKILHTIVYFNNENIWFDLMKASARCDDYKPGRRTSMKKIKKILIQNNDLGHGDNDDNNDVLEAATLLEDFSFLHLRQGEKESRSYDMHKLVQEATRYAMINQGKSNNKRLSLRKKTFGSLLRIFSRRGRANNERFHFSKTALGILLQIFPDSNHTNWPRCESLLSHALAVSAWPELSREVIYVSDLLTNKVSYYFYHQGRWGEMEAADTKTLEIHRQKLGEKHTDTLHSMGHLAVSYGEQGRFDKSEKMALEVLALRKQVLGEKHPDTMWTIAILAVTYYHQGRLNEAEEMKIKALALRKQVLGEKHPDTILCITNLASIYHAQGRLDEAEKMKIEVLEMRKRVRGEDHPDTIWSMKSLATTYYRQNKLEEAEKLCIEALELGRKSLGEKHRVIIKIMIKLTDIWHDLGKQEAAQEMQALIDAIRSESRLAL
jgi:tetratricopeptide (TPR) repeat protein